MGATEHVNICSDALLKGFSNLLNETSLVLFCLLYNVSGLCFFCMLISFNNKDMMDVDNLFY